MDYNIFITKWIKRSERKETKDFVDIGDKFISLWIAFNAWMKNKFGEAKNDSDLIEETIDLKEMEGIFENLKKKDDEFQRLLLVLQNYIIVDMRYPEEQSRKINYNGSFKSLIKSLYKIRCNLFHGRKNIEDNKNDKKLVCLAYKILLPLFKTYLKKREPCF